MASDEPAVKRVKLSEDEKSEETVDATVSSSEKLRYATVHLNLKKKLVCRVPRASLSLPLQLQRGESLHFISPSMSFLNELVEYF